MNICRLGSSAALLAGLLLAACGGGGGSTSLPPEPSLFAPTISGLPAEVSVDAGTSLTLNANVGGMPRPAMQWQRSTDDGKSWTDLPGAQASTLTIASATGVDQASRYRLKASNSQGQIISSEVKLAVLASVKLLAGAPGGAAILDGTGANARFAKAGTIAPDADGFVLIDSDSTLRTVSASGEVRSLNTSWNPAPNWWTGLTVDKDGNYIAAAVYPNIFHGSIAVSLKEVVKIDRRTGTHKVLLRSNTPNYDIAEMAGPWSIAVDATGGVLLGAEKLYRIDATGTLSVLPCVDLEAPTNSSVCQGIVGMALDQAGNLYFSALQSDRIRRRSPDGKVQTLAGGDSSGNERMFQPKALAMNAAGQLLVLDQGNYTVRLVGMDGKISTIAGAKATGADAEQRFTFPQSLAVSSKGQILVTDMTTVRQVGLDGSMHTLAGRAPTTSDPVDGSGDKARFPEASSITLGNSGELYLAMAGGSRAPHRINPDGATSTVTAVPAPTSTGLGIALGPLKSLYVGGYDAIRRINADGSTVPVIATWDRYSGQAAIEGYEDFAADANGDIYIADNVGLRVRKVSADGTVVSTLAGLLHVQGSRDGSRDVATFEKAHAVALDGRGGLYVADGSTVRKLTSDGSVSTVAGKAGQAAVVDGAAGTNRFEDARRIAVDSAGNILVLDGNRRLRRIAPDGSVSTVHIGIDLRSFTVLSPGRVAVIDENAVIVVSFL